MSLPSDKTPAGAHLRAELRASPLGIALPQGIGPDSDGATGIGAYAAAAEAFGFSSLWVSELTTVPFLDPLLALAAASAATTKVKLGVGILLVGLRPALLLANEVATVDHLSGGRLLLGVGLGSNPDLYPRFGLSPERRLSRYLSSLDLMQRLWRGDSVSDQSEWWDIDDLPGLPSAQQPRPPIFFGARRGKALERAARRGDGWIISGSAEPEEYLPAIETVEATLKATGRTRDEFTVVKRVYIAVGERESRLERAREWFERTYGKPHLADSVAVIGDVDGCLDELRRLRGLGIDHLILNPMFDEREELDLLGEELSGRL